MAITEKLDLEGVLAAGLLAMGLSLSADVQRKLIDYLLLLKKWNQVYSLTAINELHAMLVYHVLDSLSILPYVVPYGSILDFGTGPGLPGLPLALALPDCHVVLLDSNQKKTAFLTHVVGALPVANAEVVCSRAEAFHPAEHFVSIVTRATESISCIIDRTRHLCCVNTQLLVMKGKYPGTELATVSQEFTVHQLSVPYLDAQRHLVCITGIDNGKNYCHCEPEGRCR